MYSTSIPPRGPLVPLPLEAFYSMLLNLVDFWFVNQMGG